MRSANDLLRCPVCADTVSGQKLFRHMMVEHPVAAFRWSHQFVTPHQRREAYLFGVLTALAVLLILLLVLR